LIFPDLMGNKICHTARIAGHLQGCGEMPQCIGERCSLYWGCYFDMLSHRVELEKQLKTNAVLRRVLREMEEEARER